VDFIQNDALATTVEKALGIKHHAANARDQQVAEQFVATNLSRFGYLAAAGGSGQNMEDGTFN
jgi:hypothetical protein